MKKKIDSYIRENKKEIINDILEMIQIKSINGDIEGNDKALKYYLDRAKSMGLRTILGSKGDFGIVELGQGEETVGVLVHTDVVGVGDTEKWTYPPFEGRLAKGFIWGRGVVDDKGPAVMCLYALKAIKDLKLPLSKRIWIIIGTSEEAEWTDIASFREEFPVPDYGFSPDGEFPIFNREKGYCDVKMVFNEPCLDMLETLESGDSPNTIPSKAVMKIRNQEERVIHGISCHSSSPGLGTNAISKLAVEQSYRTEFNFIRFLNDFLAKDYNGTKLHIDPAEVEKNLPPERTTAVPTLLQITDQGVELNVNLRLWFTSTNERVEEAFSKFAQEYDYTFTMSDYLNPMVVDENEEFLRVMAGVYEEYGYKSSFETAVGSSYAKSMDHFVSWGPVFETEPNCAHTEDERLSIEAMVVATQMYTTYLATMASDIGTYKTNSGKMTSLDKALFLLELFTKEPYEYDVPTLAELTGMNRTTVYRNLTSLENTGLLVRNEETKKYTLGPLAVKMGSVSKALDMKN